MNIIVESVKVLLKQIEEGLADKQIKVGSINTAHPALKYGLVGTGTVGAGMIAHKSLVNSARKAKEGVSVIKPNIQAQKPVATVANRVQNSSIPKPSIPKPSIGSSIGKATDNLGGAAKDAARGFKGVAHSAIKAIGDNPKASMVGAGLLGAAALAKRRAMKRGM